MTETNCFTTSRTYLQKEISVTLDPVQWCVNKKEFTRNKDIYHVEVYTENASGHSFIIRKFQDHYKILQSFQNKYTFREEPECYSPTDIGRLLKKITSLCSYSRRSVRLIQKISKCDTFDFCSSNCDNRKCMECQQLYKTHKLFVQIHEFNTSQGGHMSP